MKKPTRKDVLIAVAQEYRGKPFFSKPVDARYRNDWVEIRHQASHELEPHWDQVVNTGQLKAEIAHYATKSDEAEVSRLTRLLVIIEPIPVAHCESDVSVQDLQTERPVERG